MSARAVVEGHHEEPYEDHGGDGADPIEVAGGNAILRPRCTHANYFLSAQVGGDKCQPADPCGNRASGEEKVGAGAHIALESHADAQYKSEVHQHDGPVDGGK